MSTIRRVLEKLEPLIFNSPIKHEYKKELAEIRGLLTDKTVLFLEWNEQDIQGVARKRIAHIEDVKECEIIENPLTKEDVETVISVLEKQYDCNYGITWEHIACAMDYIKLPSLSECKKKTGEE